VADSVESLIGAHFLSNDNLLDTLNWINDIKLVPLDKVDLNTKFGNLMQNGGSTFTHLKLIDLNRLQFDKEDCLGALLDKYFALPEVKKDISSTADFESESKLKSLVRENANQACIPSFGASIHAISHLHGQMFMSQALRRLEKLQSEGLGYKFREPLLLLQALTHRTARSKYRIQFCYEKLEILGDSVLDYLANSNLMRFTLFDKYLGQSDEYRFR